MFKYPIEYLEDKYELEKHIMDDLELTETKDSSLNSIYKLVYGPTNVFGEKSVSHIGNYYTNNIDFLRDTQDILKTYKIQSTDRSKVKNLHDNLTQMWSEIKGETGFCEKYLYVDWEFGKFLNNNSFFLQIMSLYNLSSPLISLFLPILFLIIPFIVIKSKGLQVTLSQYIEILKEVVSNHAIGKIFTQFNQVNWNQRVYLLMSAAFYVFSIYQNILVCIRFYSNMKKIHDYINTLKEYLLETQNEMKNMINTIRAYKTYNTFVTELEAKYNNIVGLYERLTNINNFSVSFKKILQLGYILEQFYRIHCDLEYEQIVSYTFGFNGYIDCLDGLQHRLNDNKLSFVTFDNSGNTKFENSYYAALIEQENVKNTCDFKKNMIITGPNASGKTTILKSNIINVILSQQYGIACCSSGTINPYKYIHCYLNIPDTSGRDSLFQAEARRCKDIIDIVEKEPNVRHFCVFDELYSGTNPEEAVGSATAFMEYLTNKSNINSILTTHFVKLCKKLGKHDNIKNYHMKTIEDTNTKSFDYTYILEKGISKVKGGHKVLKDMNYPTEILTKVI
jgi:MutS domain V